MATTKLSTDVIDLSGNTEALTIPSGTTNSTLDVEYLVVAGGGGGGWVGGGGGAGGLLTGTASFSSNATVTIGSGGLASTNGGSAGSPTGNIGGNGSNSTFDSIVATGGGGGGSHPTTAAASGGSGGGAPSSGNSSSGASASPSGQGNAGGNNSNSSPGYGAGGGGGAGAVGAAGTSTTGGNGGVGLQSNITGTNTYYAGGGGGAVQDGVNNPPTNVAGTGGLGGGANGSNNGAVVPTSATPNTGGGGGGGGTSKNGTGNWIYGNGSNGGSGTVILKYPTVNTLTVGSGLYGNYATGTTGLCSYPTTASALYQLNDNADDTCGNSDGAFTNPSYVTGKFGNAASFNGSNNYIEVPLADTPSLLVSTVTFWVKTTTTSADGIIGVGLSSSGYWQSFQAYCYGNTNGALVVRYGNGSAEGPQINSTSAINTGDWVFCAVTMSGSSVGSTIKLYVNGNLETTHTTTVSRTDSTSKGLVMGAYYAGNTSQFQNWFTGAVDQARIFPSVLTDDQISVLYAETASATTGTIGSETWSKFIGGTGTVSFANVTGGRPTSPTEGLMRENTTTGKMEFYDGSLWQEITDTASSYSPGLIPSANFNTALYTGTNATQSISSLNFKPDFIWFKNAKGTNWHALVNSVTGDRSYLFSNSTALKNDGSTSTAGNDLASFDTNGFTVGPGQVASSTNDTGGGANNTVAWSWKGGGAAVQNNDGTITGSNCMVSANVDAGFSIIKFTGTGSSFSNQTVGTGLDSAVEIYFIKGISNSGDSWIAGGSVLAVGGNNLTSFLRLNTSDAIGNTTSGSVGTSGNTINVGVRNYSSADSIVYGWHSVPGYSKIGFYVGGQPLNNPTQMYFGFTPAWIVIKNTTSSSSQWMVLDNKRTNGYAIYANSSNAESNYSADILLSSNGLEFKSNNINVNKLADIYIYMAFAE